MKSTKELEGLLTYCLASRQLERADGPLSFVHNGHAIGVTIDATTYRGHVITVLAQGRNIEFRAEPGGFNWDAIAAAIVAAADHRKPPVEDTAWSSRATGLLSRMSRGLSDEPPVAKIRWRQFDDGVVASLPFARVSPGVAESEGPSGEGWTGTNTIPIASSHIKHVEDSIDTLSAATTRFASFWSNRPTLFS